jgi:predicted phosphate transport protein (TIGR00153 family)
VFNRLMPKEEKFFDWFTAHAEQIVLGNQVLVRLLSIRNKSSEEANQYYEKIDQIRNKGHDIARETIRQLHQSFITPFDRDDILRLITYLDEILSLIQGIARTVLLYRVNHITNEAIHLGELGLSSCQCVQGAVSLLSSSNNRSKILENCYAIGRLEQQSDEELRSAMLKIFNEEPDIRELIKFKEIYRLLEMITDRCEDVADVVEGIVLENF